ncbi:hypothetical protein ACFO3J_09570 [Streptomyces polygonati]|uniref:Lipoprotein n=1 Tax=Streptomyces polygonati TaxID=1617087 RepID=A0ABV8HNG9_9ACTN
MSPSPRRSGTRPRPTAPRAAVLAAVLVLAGVAAAGCTRTVTVTSTPAAAPASAPAATTPPPAPPATTEPATAAAGNTGLQVIDSSAAQNGLNGTGGTVTGAAVQQAPPVWVQLSAVQSPRLGAHLIDINESTLYRFDKDTAQPSASNCVDACATQWPPVTVEEGGNVYLAGVDPKAVGAISRPDGRIQLTVGGWPVYRFAQDTQPGDTKGQGVGGTWFAVGPTGEKARP